MNQEAFLQRLAQKKMIASVKEAKVLEKALAADVGAVVLSIGTIGVIHRYVDLFKEQNHAVFLHLERIGGISQDREGMAYLANSVKPTGIVTTKNSLVRLAKKMGLLTIQRLFLVDSDSIKSGIQSVNDTQPDAVEIMPALLPEFIREFRQELNCPIIAGGLLRDREQMVRALEHGAIAVSLGNHQLWKENLQHETNRHASV